MQKISITRALSNLKLLDKRIRKKINSSVFIGLKKSNDDKSVPDAKEIKSSFESIQDLMKQRNKLKQAIMESNAKTIVVVAGEEMTVQEAIERKNSIAYEEELLAVMKYQFTTTIEDAEELESKNTERFDRLIESNFSKDIKSNNSEYQALYKSFWESNKIEIQDPLNLKDVINELSERIDNFHSEVDLVLSESNARTEIEI